MVICAFGAALEALFAGNGVRQRLQALRLPSYSIPFWGWIVIGLLYYTMCFVLLYRLFRSPPAEARNASLVLLGAIMFINALWNYFFFRQRDLCRAYLLGLVYSGIAIALFILFLTRLDRTTTACFAPYLAYLIYANVWSYRLWKANR